MNKPWVITHFLKELQYGFYVDINPDLNSPTQILHDTYRWRGIVISNGEEISREKSYKFHRTNLDVYPIQLYKVLYSTHCGSMIHYMRINNIKNLSNLFNVLYTEDVEKQFQHQKCYPHFNIISLELIGPPSQELKDQLYNQFDLELKRIDNNSYWFVNNILSYLL